MPSYIQVISQSLAIAQRMARANVGAERLGWLAAEPPPLRLPANAPPIPALRARRQRSPVLIAPQALPDGTTILRPPDWEWRIRPVRDTRPEAQRPAPSRLVSLPQGLRATTIEGYRPNAARRRIGTVQAYAAGVVYQ